MTPDQIADVNDVRLAFKLHKTLQEVREMSVHDRLLMLGVMMHNEEVEAIKAARRERRGRLAGR